MTDDYRQGLLQEKDMLAENVVLYKETGDRRLQKTIDRIEAISDLLAISDSQPSTDSK